jgi:transposase
MPAILTNEVGGRKTDKACSNCVTSSRASARRWSHRWASARPRAVALQTAPRAVPAPSRTHALGLSYARAKQHPCQALSKRLLRHEDALFQFVLIEGLSADTNLAERSIHPLVVIRKISGGSRSAEGTKTRLGLDSLFETWQARKLNPFDECFKLLNQPAASPA